jgi:hypothetical protein
MITKKTIQYLMSVAEPYWLRPDDYTRHRKLTVVEVMSELVVLIKYICFDRDCLRRENTYLKHLLDQKTQRGLPKDREEDDG